MGGEPLSRFLVEAWVGGVRLVPPDGAARAPLGAVAGSGATILLAPLASLTVVGYRFREGAAQGAGAARLVGWSVEELRRRAGTVIEVRDLTPRVSILAIRMALLTAFDEHGYLESASAGLVAADRLAILDGLAEEGLPVEPAASELALASVGAMLRGVTLHPSDGSTFAARSVRAALARLPVGHPGARALRRVLADVGDPATSSVWAELAVAPEGMHRSSIRAGLQRALRGGGRDVATGPKGSFATWPVLWPDGCRPPTAGAEGAPLTVTSDEAGCFLDVRLPHTPKVGASPYPCVRAVEPATGRVLAAAPIFGAGEARGHLYLDEPLDCARHRVEVAPLPAAPVLQDPTFRDRVLGAVAVAHLRAQCIGDRVSVEVFAERLQRLAPGAQPFALGSGSPWETLLADRHARGELSGQPSSE